MGMWEQRARVNPVGREETGEIDMVAEYSRGGKYMLNLKNIVKQRCVSEEEVNSIIYMLHPQLTFFLLPKCEYVLTHNNA